MHRQAMKAPLLLACCLTVSSCSEPFELAEPAPPAEAQLEVSGPGSWTNRASMPTARRGLGAAVVNDASGQPILYAIGGLDIYRNPLRRVDGYNVVTNTWSRKADLPAGAAGIGDDGAVVIDGRIYVRGGQRLYRYNPGTDRWRQLASLPVAVYGVSVALDGLLYAAGESSLGPRLYRYNPKTDIWARRANPPTTRYQGVATSIGGKLHVGGGIQPPPDENEEYDWPADGVDVYDPATNAWTTLDAGLHGRGGSAGVGLRAQLYEIGGKGTGPDLVPDGHVDAFDPSTNTWTPKARLLTPRADAAAAKVMYKGVARLLVLGGWTQDYDEPSVTLRSMEMYTP